MLETALDPGTLNDLEELRRLVLTQQATLSDRDEHLGVYRMQVAERDALIEARDRELVYKETRIAALVHELARYKRWIFTARS